jgi:acetyl-CoA acetyltransferase
MSLVPFGAAASVPVVGRPYGPGVTDRYAPGGLQAPGEVAEQLAARLVATAGVGRAELDALAAAGHAQAAAADFTAEIVAVASRIRERETGRRVDGHPFGRDEALDAPRSALADYLPLCQPGGVITAGNSAPDGDGAAAVLLMTEARAAALGAVPLARLRSLATVGAAPIDALSAAPAGRLVLERAELGWSQLDRVELDDGCAAATYDFLACMDPQRRPDATRLNRSGGAVALGRPLGAAGARALVSVVHQLAGVGGRYGMAASGDAFGVASAVVVER